MAKKKEPKRIVFQVEEIKKNEDEWLGKMVHKLNSLRKDRKLSIEKAANYIGITQDKLGRIERDGKDINVILLCKLAALYRFSLGEFLPEGLWNAGEIQIKRDKERKLVKKQKDEISKYTEEHQALLDKLNGKK